MENKLTDCKEWRALASHQQELAGMHMRDMFISDPNRFRHFSLEAAGLFLDYSRNRITQTTLSLLTDLAAASNLKTKIQDLLNGQKINTTEHRAALHTALRSINHYPTDQIASQIQAARQQLSQFVEQIHSAQWRGVTGKPIKYIVNVGIGGSYLGPLMTITALRDYAINDLVFHFIACVDQTSIQDVLTKIDPEATLFIISSKSFATFETLTNAKYLIKWMTSRLGDKALKQHFVAITASPEKAQALGIPTAQIFPLWDWVGGRYSVWSAIGLPLMLMLGMPQFDEFLRGGRDMDEHYQQADFAHNMPVIMALISIWYTNFFNVTAQVIAPYSQRLMYLVAYLQQLQMESNGKDVDINGHTIDYLTSPILFGEAGCNAQHTYHQLLHQGSHLVPVDFILNGDSSNDLLASAISQAQALMCGKTQSANYQTLPGNRPSNLLFMDKITPRTLGALIALYEHKTYTQSVIWEVNSFDQWGVELGKQLLPDILNQLADTTPPSSIQHFIDYVKVARVKNNES